MAGKRDRGRPPSAETIAIREALALKAKIDARRVQARYDAAGMGRRMAAWNPPTQGPNRALEGLQRIRNRARDVSSNDWSGESSVQKWTTTLIGIGITPRFKRITNKERKKQIVDLWNDFVAKADADCVLNLYAMQTLVVRSWLDAGEVFVRRRSRFLDEGLPVPMQAQIIEAEFVPMLDVDSYEGLPAGHRIRSGIELDKRGKRVAYWMYKEHPGDGTGMLLMPDELVRVAASEICHVYEPKRAGQLRGVSMLAPVLNRLKTIENYDDATLTRQQLANLIVGFITRGLPDLDDDDDINPLSNQENVQGSAGPLLGLQPGLIQELEDGQKVEWSNPPEAGTNYSEYMRTQHMGTSAAAGLPYELFAGDIKEVSDRTLRVIINEFRRFAEQRQWQIVIPMFCQPVIEWFASAALLAGKITIDEVDDVRRVEHAPHGWSHIHPVQDPQGKKLEVEAGFRSRSSVVGEQGDDVDTVDDERQADDQREQELGIGPYSEANKLQSPNAAGSDSEDEEDDDSSSQQPGALDLALIARANAEADALVAQAARLRLPPQPDPDAAARAALQERIVKLLEPAGGSE
jgi:lambda family phage portal protein